MGKRKNKKKQNTVKTDEREKITAGLSVNLMLHGWAFVPGWMGGVYVAKVSRPPKFSRVSICSFMCKEDENDKDVNRFMP